MAEQRNIQGEEHYILDTEPEMTIDHHQDG